MAHSLASGFVAAALVVAGCAGGHGRGGGSILFNTRGGIYTVRADGTGLRDVTPYNGNYPPLPAWSPDGTQIAFDQIPGRCECRIDLYYVRRDGTGLRRLTRGGLNSAPAWSPDGKLIAFDGMSAIWVVAPDGTGLKRLTSRGIHGEPVWSPDGRQIAFRTLDDSIYVMSLDGGRLRRLVRHGGDPVWSPDAGHIVFDRPAPGGCRCRIDIYVVATDGSGMRRLSRGRARSHSPSWSRDGRIAFRRRPGGLGDLRHGRRREPRAAFDGPLGQSRRAGLVTGRQTDRLHRCPRLLRGAEHLRDGRERPAPPPRHTRRQPGLG